MAAPDYLHLDFVISHHLPQTVKQDQTEKTISVPRLHNRNTVCACYRKY